MQDVSTVWFLLNVHTCIGSRMTNTPLAVGFFVTKLILFVKKLTGQLTGTKNQLLITIKLFC